MLRTVVKAVKTLSYGIAGIGWWHWGAAAAEWSSQPWAGMLVVMAGSGLCVYAALAQDDDGPPRPPVETFWGDDRS